MTPEVDRGARVVWGEKEILDALRSLMGWRPSRRWLYDWRAKPGAQRLPVSTLDGSNRLYADATDLEAWWRARLSRGSDGGRP